MLFCALLLSTLADLALAFPTIERDLPSFVFDGDAPFSVDTATLAAALTCPDGNPTESSPPVLLVHGTATTGEESWSRSYVPALKANGYTGCWVTLPGRAMGDMQISSEYVAYNLHYLSYLSGGLETAVISHSQGGPDTQWALQFWPSTTTVTSSFIPLAPDLSGILLFDSDLSDVCVGNICQASLWQQSSGSNYFEALHYSNFKAQVPTTTIWTETDGVVSPPEENAALPDATSYSIQELCPLRLAIHTQMTTDAAAFALALDALQNGGTASISRVRENSLEICLEVAAPDMNEDVAADLAADFDALIDGFLEPAIMAYAQPSNCPDQAQVVKMYTAVSNGVVP
ncbi:alpha/beta-hydrolase [Teratosphaeria nubilosa]|uniref:Alpha/beta-hydrolase n=1 Tax=Teratosphaeria nubilosa TaxID=161662 RepID=A0A6G1LI85_9PEZI|nr:alpha/beta-hydrolase [Teratosphaeria nubilosa]